jgi:predicted hotdog family 3-hydroxylacyl-ACP dehydratase
VSTPFPALAELLPHAAPAILLDRVLAGSASGLVAEVSIGPATPWRLDAGVPVHVAIEYMAQACAAFVGLEAHTAGGRPRIGLLLGTRDFRAERAWLSDGEVLEVSVALVFRDEQMGVFDASVSSGGAPVCRAQLTVVQPEDLAAVLSQAGGTDDA